VFWGGHGIITKSKETRRRLLFSDTDNNNPKNLDFYSLQEALKNSAYNSGFARQVYFIDACANPLYTEHFDITGVEQAGERFSSNGDAQNNKQFVLYASPEYEIAENQAGTGSFSQAVMEELIKLPKDCLLPNMEHLTEQVTDNLLADDKPNPVSWLLHWDGSQEEYGSGFPKIDWREVCREMLAERQKLTSNPLTSTEGIALQVKDVYVGVGLVERKKQSKLQDDKKLSEQQDSFDSKKGS
jgi:hypothetical protein